MSVWGGSNEMKKQHLAGITILISISLLIGFFIGSQGSCPEPELCKCPQLSYTNVTECLMELENCQLDLNETLRFKDYYKNKLEGTKDE